MNGLVRRLEVLERNVSQTQRVFHDHLMRRVLERADTIRMLPEKPADQQSVLDRCIRAALADAEGSQGSEHVTAFWNSFVARWRAYAHGGAV